MSAVVLPFRASPPKISRAERIAARRTYRKGCADLAAQAVAQAFTESGTLPGTQGLGVDDAFPIFVAAMRRELRKSGLF